MESFLSTQSGSEVSIAVHILNLSVMHQIQFPMLTICMVYLCLMLVVCYVAADFA